MQNQSQSVMTMVRLSKNIDNHYQNNKLTVSSRMLDKLFFISNSNNLKTIGTGNPFLVNNIKAKRTLKYDSFLRHIKREFKILDQNGFTKRNHVWKSGKDGSKYIVARNGLSLNKELIIKLINKMSKLTPEEEVECLALAEEFKGSKIDNVSYFIYLCNLYIDEKIYTMVDLLNINKAKYKYKLFMFLAKRIKRKNSVDEVVFTADGKKEIFNYNKFKDKSYLNRTFNQDEIIEEDKELLGEFIEVIS